MDILIKGGTIVDGSGNPGFFASIGIDKDRLFIVRGDVSHIEAARVIHAEGRIICPGFIDVHSHSALSLLKDPYHLPKIHQGVTTELIGVDGNSYAPFLRREDLEEFVELNGGLEGRAPSRRLWWSSVSEYLGCYENSTAINIAYTVGNSPLRISAMGWNDRRASVGEMARMKSLLEEAMTEGAIGLSTGLDYPPGSYADTDELVELARVVARLGGIYHTHVRYGLGDRFLDPYREAIEIGRRSGAPVHLTHMHPKPSYPRSSMLLLDLVEEARGNGLDVTFDCIPYAHGGTRLVAFLPPWTHDGGVTRIYEVLGSREERDLLKEEVTLMGREGWHDVRLTHFKRDHNKPYEGLSVQAIAEITGESMVDTICDLLLDEDLQISFHSSELDAALLPVFFTHPAMMVASDAPLLGESPPAAAYGAFPTVIAKFCRDDRRMSLQEAIRKMTSFPAQRLGLTRRGVLRDGMKADLVIFDYATLSAPATRDSPKQFCSGIDYVIVNGQVVIDHGTHTGALPGEVERLSDS